jgi:hypothetical protein
MLAGLAVDGSFGARANPFQSLPVWRPQWHRQVKMAVSRLQCIYRVVTGAAGYSAFGAVILHKNVYFFAPSIMCVLCDVSQH